MADSWDQFQEIAVAPPKALPKPAAASMADDWSAFVPIGPGTASEPATAVPATPLGPLSQLITGGDPSKPNVDSPEYVAYLAKKHNVSPEHVEGLRQAQVPGEALKGTPILGGLVDRAGAGISALAQPLTGAGAADDTLGGRYAKNLALEKEIATDWEREHPGMSMGLQIGGGILTTAPVAATAIGARALGLGGTTLPGQIGRGVASGATIGGADAAVRGENPIHGAEIGGLFGGALPVAGRAVGSVVRSVRDAVVPPPRVPQGTFPVAGVDVPLSSGQITGSVDTQMAENAARRGGMGDQAATTAGRFDQLQGRAVGQASENIRSGFDPQGRVIATDPQAAAAAVGEGIQQRAQGARQHYETLYDEFAGLPGTIPRAAFDNVGDSIRARMTLGANPVIIDDVTTPYAARALRDVEQQVGGTRFQNQAAPGVMQTANLPRQAIDAVGLSDIDQARKRLLSFARDARSSGNAADARATQRVIGEFDQHLHDVIDAGLFSGSTRALPALQEARAAFRDYRQTFTPQGAGDDVGPVIQKITGRYDGQAATPTEISNYLYGASGIGNTGLSVRLAQRLRGMLGADSPEWSAVRQGMWSKLTENVEGRVDWGPQKIAGRMADFLNGPGQPLAHVLFSQQERQLMGQYAALQRQLQPVAGSINYSNTAPVLKKIMGGVTHSLLPMLGLSAGGLPGGLVAFAADRAMKAAGERANANRVARSFYGNPQQADVDANRMRRLALMAQIAGRGSIPALTDQRGGGR